MSETIDRNEVTRQTIAAKAEELFRTLGYQKTTVADIARALRMSPANVYRFFASKTAINEAICARILNGLEETAWSVARRQQPADVRLRTFFAVMQQQTMSLFFHEKQLHDMVEAALEEHWPVIETHIRTIETALRHIIMDGQAERRFAPMDPEQTASLVHATMIAFVHPGLISQCRVPDDLPQQAASMAEFVLRALRPD